MKIYRSCKTNLISQCFGENKNSIYKEWNLAGHNGIDWLIQDGEPVYFDVDGRGKVIEVSLDYSAGLGVVVQTEGFKHIFWHLKRVDVKVGDIVETGDLLGLGDSTGYSTGPHLHRGLKKCDENGITINRDNSYDGAIDPILFLQNIWVVDKKKFLEEKLSVLTGIVNLLKLLIGLKTKGR